MPHSISHTYTLGQLYFMRVSIALLSYDHGIIRQVVDVLGEILGANQQPDFMVEAKEISAFLTDFIDKFHHKKEETYLFPIASSKVPELATTVLELVSDHAKARELLAAMNASIGEKANWGVFSASASSLIEHVTAHINKEELFVFGKIEEVLTREEDRGLIQAMNEFANRFRPNYYRTAEDFSKSIQDRVLGPDYFSKAKKSEEAD
jgi:hemerythrin-like domain-containing protein